MGADAYAADLEDAFEELVDRLAGRIALFLAQLVRDRDLAEDLLQDTLLVAYRERTQLPKIANRDAWLFAIAKNRALDAGRRRQRRGRALERLFRLPPEAVEDPAEAAATRDLLERHLDPSDRALVILRYLHGFDSRELGEVFGISPEAVRQRLSRARHRLRVASGSAASEPSSAELRPRGPSVVRYADEAGDEDDLAFAQLLAPLQGVVPAPRSRNRGPLWRRLHR